MRIGQDNTMLYWLVAFTATFLFQVSNVYVANMLFFVWMIIVLATKKPRYAFDQKELLIFAIYLIWILFSMIVFIIQYGHLEMRNIVQFLYNVQYIILLVNGSIDKARLRKAMHVCSYFLAVVIIALWVTQMGMMSVPTLIVHYREWAKGYIGGWPNTTVLPLVFGVYVEMEAIMRERKVMRIVPLGVLLFAILLCTSRTGYVGIALVVAYFLFIEIEGTKLRWRILKHTISIVMVVVIIVSGKSIIAANGMGGRMYMVADRLDIFRDMFIYIGNHPIIGYGGNSVDVIYQVVGKTATGINWGHTHNTILELMIRHGIIGTLAFCLLVFRISKRIIIKEDKAMYWILWALSTLQIFYKDFVFLLLVYLLIPSKTLDRELSDDIEIIKVEHEIK